MSDEVKKWKVPADLDPAIYSGKLLLEKLTESGTGESKLAFGHAVFPLDDDTGEVTTDVPAVDVAKAMFRSEWVPDTTKDKVMQFLTTGVYVPPKQKDESVVKKLESVKPLEKPAKKKAEKVEKVDEKQVK